MKILMTPLNQIKLSRSEIVALINVLHRLSISISAVNVIRDLELQKRLHGILVSAFFCMFLIFLGLFFVRFFLARVQRRSKGNQSTEIRHTASGEGSEMRNRIQGNFRTKTFAKRKSGSTKRKYSTENSNFSKIRMS